MNKIRTFIIEKSKYPEEEKTHILIRKTVTEHGMNEQRVFKGTLQECKEEKRRIEDVIRKYL